MKNVYRFLSLKAWGSLPAPSQRKISAIYANLYNKKLSKHFIKPYCRAHYSDPDYLNNFLPPDGKSDYETFQDFFIRKFKNPPQIDSEHVWPCEGLLCDYGKVADLPAVNVKGDRRKVSVIFGGAAKDIPKDYYFSNVFLHNNNYHRIHSPVSGTIERIEHIPGELILLRPWIYANDPSQPAFRNERINVDITDNLNRKWYLSIVGGPAVGTIRLNDVSKLGNKVGAGDEIGTFLLGSTCCIASPEPSQALVGSNVFVGMDY